MRNRNTEAMRKRKITLICPDCRHEFVSDAPRVKYCPDCRLKRFRLNNVPEFRNCAYPPCGIEYQTTRGWGKYCCTAHRVADYKRRMAEHKMVHTVV